MSGAQDRDNLHSWLVGWLKIVLPLVALALLSTLFMIARTIDPSDAIPFAEVDVADRLREPRMTKPTYAGVTADGSSLLVYADEARPDAADGTSPWAKGLRADLYTPDGGTFNLTAPKVVMDIEGGILHLSGGVDIATSSKFHITTETLSVTIDRTRLQSGGKITATSALGLLEAGQMVITERSESPGTYVLVFQNRVKLIYRPSH